MKIDYLDKLNFIEIDHIEDLKTSRGTVEFHDDSRSSKISNPDLRYFWDGQRFGLHVSDLFYRWEDFTFFLNRHIEILPKFKVLYIGRTLFEKFSPLKSDLCNLEFLCLSENTRLTDLDCENLASLKVLLTSNCAKLENIFFNGYYPNLEFLDLSNCSFVEINFANAKFPSLQSINLGGNPLRMELPFVLHGAPNVHFVHGIKELAGVDNSFFEGIDLNARKLFAQNIIEEIEEEINQFKDVDRSIRLTDKNYKLNDEDRIHFLDLGHLDLKIIPGKLLEIETLEHLCLGAYFPNKVGGFHNIFWQKSYFHEISNSNFNIISSIELEKLTSLPRLKSLYVNSIDLDSIDFVKKLLNLVSLDITGNARITDFKPISELKKLKLFHASSIPSFSNNDTKYLPSSICSLSLEACNISKLEFINDLNKSEYIFLNSNTITTENLFNFLIDSNGEIKEKLLPLIKSTNDNKLGIFISNNLIDEGLYSILDEVDLENKRLSLKTYHSNVIIEDEIQFTQVKLILIGNTKAGKTTLFDIFSKEVPGYKIKSTGNSTHGLNIGAIEYLDDKNNLDFLLKIYDFGGQDYYHSTHWPYFSTENTQYVLIFRNDCDDKFDIFESDEIKEMIFPINYWLDSIIGMKNQVNNYSTNSNEQINLHLLQNCYHFPPSDLNLKNIKTKYRNHLNIGVLNPTLLRGVLENHGGNTYETYKKYLVQTIRQKTRNYTVIPKSRYDFINQLKQNPKGLIRKNAVAFSNKSKNWIDLSMELAHNTYDFICRKEDKLKDFAITNISKFNEYIFTILKKEKDGYFTHDDAKSRLKKFNLDEFEIQYILSFMELNKIIFNIKNSGNYLAPAFLSDELSKSEEILIKTFTKKLIQYEFHSYFHSNIFTEIVLRFSEDKSLLEDGLLEKNWRYVLKKGYVFLFDSSDNKNLLHIKFELNEIPIITVYNHSIFGVNEDFIELIHKKLDMIVGYEVENSDKVRKLVFNKYQHSIDFRILKNEEIFSPDGNKTDLLISQNRLLRKGDFRIFLEKEERNQLKMKNIFISYSKFDEQYKDEFKSHLITLKRQDLVETFDDRDIESGDKFDTVIKQKIQDCDLFICLVSRHFLNVDYIFKEEFPFALENNKTIIPVIIRPCDWENMPVSGGEKLGDWNAHNKANVLTLKPENQNEYGQKFAGEYSAIERDNMWLKLIKEIRSIIETDKK